MFDKILITPLKFLFTVQKQPPEVFYEKVVLNNFAYIHRETPVLESLFNKVAVPKACNFIKKRLQHRCFPVNIAKYLRTPILKNIRQQLLFTVILTH